MKIKHLYRPYCSIKILKALVQKFPKRKLTRWEGGYSLIFKDRLRLSLILLRDLNIFALKIHNYNKK